MKICEVKNAKYQVNAIIKRKISNQIDFLRFAQESIFSGLNNLTVNSVMDEEYDSFFGFTENEVKDMLSYYGVSDKEKELKEWYDGYLSQSDKTPSSKRSEGRGYNKLVSVGVTISD